MTYNCSIAAGVDSDKANAILRKAAEYAEAVFGSLKASETFREAEFDEPGDIAIIFPDGSDCFEDNREDGGDLASRFIKAETDGIHVFLERARGLFDDKGFLDAVRFDLRQLGELDKEETVLEFVSIHLANGIIRFIL